VPVVAPRATLSLPALEPVPTAPARAADVLRTAIFEGRFAPGTPLPEVALAASLRVSRSTVREALRVLVAEHLLTVETHKGAAVRALTEADVLDVYAGRRMVELSALDTPAARDLPADAFAGPLGEGDAAAAAGDWLAVGTANLRFHAELAGLHGSPRVSEFFARLMTELRLGFLALPEPEALHDPYLAQNHALAALLRAGDRDAARGELAAYLDDAAAQVAAAVRAP
jgi:DNA-binding GntR family transcriptional regulator